GCDVSLRQDGSLIVAETVARGRTLEERAATLRAEGTDVAWLPSKELRAREPLLSPELAGALYVGSDAHVDNRALCSALMAAPHRLHVRVREQCGVRSLIIESNRVRGVVTCEGPLKGDAVLLASGAWLNRGGETDASALPQVVPVKGQMIALEPPRCT